MDDDEVAEARDGNGVLDSMRRKFQWDDKRASLGGLQTGKDESRHLRHCWSVAGNEVRIDLGTECTP